MSKHAGLSRLTKDDLCDKYITLYDSHDELKRTARLQEERIKRLATKVLRLAEDKKKLQKSGGQTDHINDSVADELSDQNTRLENENRNLLKKMDEYKQKYVELLNKKKVVTSRTDSGLPFPSAGRSIPKRSSSLRRVESSNIDLNHHLVAAQEENKNMLQAIAVLQRKLAETSAEKQNYKIQLEHKNQMLDLTTTNRDVQNSDMMAEIGRTRAQNQKAQTVNQSLLLQLDSERNKVTLLQSQLDAVNLAHKAMSRELDSAQEMTKLEMEKVAKLQSEKRQMMTIREELSLEQEAKRDLETERDMIKEQLQRVIRADQAGSNIWKERETQFQRQLKLMEETLGSDAKDAQRLRVELHQEKIVNKRLSVKLDELESSLVEMKNSQNVLSKIDQNSQLSEKIDNQPVLPIVTSRSGNSSEELEIALRQANRKVKNLEEKLVTSNKHIKRKEEELLARCDHLEQEKRNLYDEAQKQAIVIDEQNDQIKTLTSNLKQIGIEGRVPDLPQLTSSKLLTEPTSKLTTLGHNDIVLSLTKCQIFRKMPDVSPVIFCLAEFSNFQPVSTTVCSGLELNFNFKHSYTVEVSEDFLSVLSDSFIHLSLYQVILGTEHKLIGRSKIPLRKLLERQQLSGQAEIFPVSPGSTLGALSFELAAKIPFENAAALYVERKSAGGYLGDSLSETSIENELEIEIIAGKDLESQYEGEIPSCFVTYSFYTYDICHTNVVINQSFPNFSYVRKHRVEENDNLEKYLATEKLRFVVVDQEDNEEDYLGICDIPLISLVDNHEIHGEFALIDSENADSGSIEVRIRWIKPYKKRSRPIQDIGIKKSEIDETPLIPPRSNVSVKSSKNSKLLIESHLAKTEFETEAISLAKEESLALEFDNTSITSVKSKEPEYDDPIDNENPEALEKSKVSLISEVSKKSEISQKIEDLNAVETETQESFISENATILDDKKLKNEEEIEEDVISESIEAENPISDNENDVEVPEPAVSETGQSVAESEQSKISMRFTEAKSGESDYESTPPSARQSDEIPDITINIKELIGKVENNKNVFIEFEFCGNLYEIIDSFPFPSDSSIQLDFQNKIQFKHGSEELDHLKSMLLPHADANSNVTFTLAADPGVTEDEDCEDLATARIDLKTFLTEEDYTDKEISFKSNSDEIIAVMIVDMKAATAVSHVITKLTT